MPISNAIAGKLITYEERINSRAGSYGSSGSTQRGMWWFKSTDANNEPVELLENELILAATTAPEISNGTNAGHALDGIDYEPMEDKNCSWWLVTANYVEPSMLALSRPQAGTARLRWTARGEQEKIISPVTPTPITYIPALPTLPLAAPRVFIGDDGRGEKTPSGVSVFRPKFGFAFDFTIAGGNVNSNYMGLAAQAVGKVNEFTWTVDGLAFPKGKVLCTSITGTFSFGQDSTLAFEFAVSKNETGKTIGGIQDIEKEGWQYADVMPKFEVKGGNAIVGEARQVDIWTVYEYFDMVLLDIPGTS